MTKEELLKQFEEKFTAFENVYADKTELRDFISLAFDAGREAGERKCLERNSGMTYEERQKALDKYYNRTNSKENDHA